MRATRPPLDPTEVVALCNRVLGECAVVADHSWPHRESLVLEVRTRSGRHWIAKRCRQREHFLQEVAAYRDWVGALDGMAPRMISCDEPTNTLLITFEPGLIREHTSPLVHERAGTLIRKFHEAAPPRPAADFALRMQERLEQGLARGQHLLPRADIDLIWAQVTMLADLPAPLYVPTHQDNQPRNWLVDGDDNVRLIDFGLSKWDAWARDLLRLYYWDWRLDPALADAFLTGYGRSLSDVDRQLLIGLGAITALMTILWAYDHDDLEFGQRGWRAIELVRAEAA